MSGKVSDMVDQADVLLKHASPRSECNEFARGLKDLLASARDSYGDAAKSDGQQHADDMNDGNEAVIAAGERLGQIAEKLCPLPQSVVDLLGRGDVPSGDVVVATVVSTGDMVTERVCVEQDGRYILEAEAEAANLASGFLTLDDGSAEGDYVGSAIRLAGNPPSARSESLALRAGGPCYLMIAQTGDRRLRCHGTPDQVANRRVPFDNPAHHRRTDRSGLRPLPFAFESRWRGVAVVD